jgi:NADP+-dependent farnesol dehydrogenase
LHFQSENIQTAFNSIALRVCKPKIMEKWSGKTAVVTGASAGIGIAIVKSLVQHGVNVVGLARRVERVEVIFFHQIEHFFRKTFFQELANELQDAAGKVSAFKCDVSDQLSVQNAFEWIEEKFGGVDILINNAGVYK